MCALVAAPTIAHMDFGPWPEDELAVLVVYVNCAVALALAARLVDFATITLAPPAGALRALEGEGRVDVVVFCPYLDVVERDMVRAAIGRRSRPAPWVQLVDVPDHAVAHLNGPVEQSPAESRALAQILDSLEA